MTVSNKFPTIIHNPKTISVKEEISLPFELKKYSKNDTEEQLSIAAYEEPKAIRVMKGSGWTLIENNEYSIEISEGDIIYIPPYSYLNLVPGSSNELILSIRY